MKIEWEDFNDPVEVTVEAGGDVRVAKANRDGTYQILVFDGSRYVLFTRARITAFKGYADNDGCIYKATPKDVWDNWGSRIPSMEAESEEE